MRLGNDEVDLYFEFQKKMLRTNDNPKPFTWHLLAFFGSGNFLPLRPGTNEAILSETIICKSRQVRASFIGQIQQLAIKIPIPPFSFKKTKMVRVDRLCLL